MCDTTQIIDPEERMTVSFWQWAAQGGDYVLVLCGVIISVCVAVSWLYKAWQRASKPHRDLKARVEELACKHDDYDEYFKADKQRLDGLEADNKLVLRGVMQLMTHEIDGNHVDALRDARDDIQQHLIDR